MKRWHPVPAALYALVEKTPGTMLLETSRPGGSRISRVFTGPTRVIEAHTPAEIDALFPAIEDAIALGHSAAGFFAYESGQSFEPTAGQRAPRQGDLLAWFGIYERCLCFDHHTGSFVGSALHDLPYPPEAEPSPSPSLSVGLDQPLYSARIARIHEWIRAGDVYQLNFTFPLRSEIAEKPAALYARLHAAQPVEYGGFLHCRPGGFILSFSPELFFRIRNDGTGRFITTRPMKGTARRGRTTTEDREIATWLANDQKNRAENVMIVDLIRNDLGRICNFGSVQVENLFEVERLPTLWQMTSTIGGELRPEVRCKDVFRALFPCGSVTGAPKIRAMQLLAQIEDEPRGVYTGAIGFFSREESVFNVAIRTLELEDSRGTMGIGSGIVTDSDAAEEFRECRLKAEFLTGSAEPFSLIETMLWKGDYPLLDLHLDRLDDSSDYFGFSCDRTAVKAALLEAAEKFFGSLPRKVRLLLNADGTVRIESDPLAASPVGILNPVCLAAERTDPEDRFLFHKTTRRALYNQAFARASAAGFVDVLFVNTHGQVTEGAISNVLIEKEGLWYTPPIECGVLPGVYRRHLMKSRPEIREKILALDDLKSADAVYICNAVRGLRRVKVFLSSISE